MVVGVSGKYCAGKSQVTEILLARGYREIDVDALGHDALRSERAGVVAAFGEEILTAGEVDRKKLGAIVFRDEEARRRLEAIVHPVMRERAAAAAAESRNSHYPLVVDAALLFYMELHRSCDTVIWVDAPLPLRFLRALRRDGLPIGQTIARFRAQAHITPQPYLQDVDITRVNNWGSRARLTRRISEIPGVLSER